MNLGIGTEPYLRLYSNIAFDPEKIHLIEKKMIKNLNAVQLFKH